MGPAAERMCEGCGGGHYLKCSFIRSVRQDSKILFFSLLIVSISSLISRSFCGTSEFLPISISKTMLSWPGSGDGTEPTLIVPMHAALGRSKTHCNVKPRAAMTPLGYCA